MATAPSRGGSRRFIDGLSNTVLLGEGMRLCDGTYRLALFGHYAFQHSHNFGVDWNGVPNTFMFQSAARPKNVQQLAGCKGMHFGQLSVALTDGSVRCVSRTMTRRETERSGPARVGRRSGRSAPATTACGSGCSSRPTTSRWGR